SVDDRDVCKPIVKAPPPPPPPGGGLTGTGPTPPPETPADKGPKKRANILRYAGIGVLALGGIGFGLRTSYGMPAQSIRCNSTNPNVNDPWPANIKMQEAEGQSDENKQIAFMIGGGAVMVAGVVMIFVGTAKAETPATSTSVSFAPLANHDTVGVSAAGRF